ncbi:hypothetical protein RFI_11182 [Reticulomyxa filosa]|uniref:Uncharacterized protein n=1 Tax=Reticulomyxa filosa TaxID=46433 RepID=X6NJR2_RETFI|nr:hypothetical protein RFI_11182 [Reticulomyxa filosa]|eukprot:ETO25954.1 hypothetical protein RFI_11182 [Reticulomyxa filosa]
MEENRLAQSYPWSCSSIPIIENTLKNIAVGGNSSDNTIFIDNAASDCSFHCIPNQVMSILCSFNETFFLFDYKKKKKKKKKD